MTKPDLSGKGKKRAGKPKVKTGCVTCRIRRVKCDEGTPACLRCLKVGAACGGYTVHPKLIQRTSKEIAILPKTSSLSVYSPSARLPLNEREMRYFQDFVENSSFGLQAANFNSHEVSTLHDSFFWNQLALQQSHSSSYVRHAIVAMGALARSLQVTDTIGGCHFRSLDTRDLDHQFALVHYAKAIRAMHQSIRAQKTTGDEKFLLIGCLVLANFDTFHGNIDYAMMHIAYGRQAVTDWQSRKETLSWPWIDVLDNKLSRMLMRLDLQFLGFTGQDPQCSYLDLEKFGKFGVSIPQTFPSIDDAMDWANLFLFKTYNAYMQFYRFRAAPRDTIPSAFFELREYFIERLHCWKSAVQPLMSLAPSLGPPLSRPESVYLYPAIALIRLTSSLNAPETECDTLMEAFRFILKVSRDVVEFEKKHPSTVSTFVFEVRILPGLYLVATKCRDFSLRSEAIKLLMSSHRREGLWDSFLAGKVAAWIKSIEEEGMTESGYIPEHARAYAETMEMDMQTRKATVRCLQKVEVPVGGYRIRTSSITW